MSGLPGNRLDLYQTLLNLRNFATEEALNEAGMATRQDDPRTLVCALNRHHVGTDAVTVFVGFARHLLIVRKDRLKLVAQLDHSREPVTALLHDTRDNGALFAGVGSQHSGILGFTQTLGDHRTGGDGGNPAEV